jgi:hypothetical protein
MKAQWESRGIALTLLYKLGTSWGMSGQRYTLATFPGREAQNPLYNVGKLWGGPTTNKQKQKQNKTKKTKQNTQKVPLWRSLALLGLSYRTFQ